MLAIDLASTKQSLNFTRELDQGDSIIAEYVWIDGAMGVRSKARTITGVKEITSLDQLPEWNYDGSSCYQASTSNSEIIVKPVAFFRDPFRGGKNVVVMTETYMWEDNTYSKLIPANSNFRYYAKQIFEAFPDEEPWYGIEQEYTLLDEKNRFTIHPYGWPKAGFPGNQGPYYCSAGGNVTFGRTIADAVYRCCLHAGIKVSGINAEVMPGQWEFQIGPCTGLEIGDHLWMARYFLHRCAEEYGLIASFTPKLFDDWNGSGCHCNFSTKTMREGSGGMKYIEDMMVKFEEKHKLHMVLYGEDNNKRLTGIHETSSFHEFSYGTGNRGASFRIPTQVRNQDGKGYIEDRRPASNICPYLVSSIIYDTSVLPESKAVPMVEHFNKWKESISKMVIEKA